MAFCTALAAHARRSTSLHPCFELHFILVLTCLQAQESTAIQNVPQAKTDTGPGTGQVSGGGGGHGGGRGSGRGTGRGRGRNGDRGRGRGGGRGRRDHDAQRSHQTGAEGPYKAHQGPTALPSEMAQNVAPAATGMTDNGMCLDPLILYCVCCLCLLPEDKREGGGRCWMHTVAGLTRSIQRK